MAVGVLFLLTGLGVIFYLNQTPSQPRERDYSYVGSFFAFSLWIGIGATGIIELASDIVKHGREAVGRLATTAAGTALVALMFVPFWVAYQNYDDHDRSGRYVATDYAYNLLMSLEKNAIVFTNGDNDTFPLWYLQEVEGVRQDVRVVCLSLLNTKWYIRQMRDKSSRSSAPLPMSFSDSQIDKLQVAPWQAQEIALPVDLDAILDHGEMWIAPDDQALIESPMRWTLTGRRYSDEFNMLYVADQAALDIIVQNARTNWQRPIYFANTTSRDGQLDLQPYFQAEGLAYRIVPIKNDQGLQGRVVPELQAERLSRLRYTNLDNDEVYYDENIRRMIDNYRLTFAHASERMALAGETEMAEKILDTLMLRVPFETIPGDLFSSLSVARSYEAIGNYGKMLAAIRVAEPILLDRLAASTTERQIQQLQQFIQMIQVAYFRDGDFDAAAGFMENLALVSGDSSLAQTADELRAVYGGLVRPGARQESEEEAQPSDGSEGALEQPAETDRSGSQ